ncbi:MAG: hypothetical protein ACR2HA_05130 [Nocardioides sp.]
MAVTAFQSHIDAPASMRLALRAGYALLVAGLLAGVAMIVRGTTLVRTGHRTAGYAEAGFLKAFHSVTLHAVLVLPLLAWWLAHRGIADPRRRTLIVAGAVAVNLTAAVVVLMRSLLTPLSRAATQGRRQGKVERRGRPGQVVIRVIAVHRPGKELQIADFLDMVSCPRLDPLGGISRR